MTRRRHIKLVREGEYAAEVEIELIDTGEGWSPYVSLEDAQKLDDVREALAEGISRPQVNAPVSSVSPPSPCEVILSALRRWRHSRLFPPSSSHGVSGEEILNCPHVKGRAYDGITARKINGELCNICGDRLCGHIPGNTYDHVRVFGVVVEMEVDHVSFVENPA